MSQSLDRALLTLERLAVEPLTIGEVGGQLGVHNSTALRLLQTLEGHRFVRRDTDHRYRLGAAFLTLAQQAVDSLDIRQAAHPFLVRLNQETGHTVHLAEFDGQEVVYIDKIEGRTSPRIYSKIGRRAPLHCTGLAKAIIAFLPDPERAALVYRNDYRLYTPRTIQSPERLLDELAQVRTRGYAIDDREHEPLISCIAAPVHESGGRVRYAISLTIGTADVTNLSPSIPVLLAVAQDLSTDLGWAPVDGDPGERAVTTEQRLSLAAASSKVSRFHSAEA